MAEPLDFEAFCLGQHAPLIRMLTLDAGTWRSPVT